MTVIVPITPLNIHSIKICCASCLQGWENVSARWGITKLDLLFTVQYWGERLQPCINLLLLSFNFKDSNFLQTNLLQPFLYTCAIFLLHNLSYLMLRMFLQVSFCFCDNHIVCRCSFLRTKKCREGEAGREIRAFRKFS